LSNRRRFIAPFRSDESAAANFSRRAGASFGRTGRPVAQQVAYEDFRQAPGSLRARNAWRSSAFAQVAFSLVAAACDALAILAAALISELSYEWFFHDHGGANSMALIGSMVAALFVLPNATRGEYRIDNYLKLNGQVGRISAITHGHFAL